MVVPSKQRILTKVLNHLSKTYDVRLPDGLSVLDHLLIGVLQEGTSFPRAHAAFTHLLAGFHDLNELRVSHPAELAERLENVADQEEKSQRILSILQFVFETTYTYDLESMRRKPLKQAQKQLSKISGVTEFSVAAVVQRALGGHSLPVDEEMRGVLVQLGLVDKEDPLDKVRTGLEHLVPKTSGVAFCLLIGELAADDQGREAVLASILAKPKRRAAKSATTKAKAADKPSKGKK